MATGLAALTLIDAHTHIVPGALDEAAAIMKANDLAAIVNLGVLETEGIPFDEGMSAFKSLGERMLYFPAPDFADVAPGFGERMAEALERKVEKGAAGLKIFKALGLQHRDAEGRLIPVDDPRLDPLWAKAGALGVPVLIHSSDMAAHFLPLDENNEQREALTRFPDWHVYGSQFGHDELLEQRDRVIARHPGTVFIGAHIGMYPENLLHVNARLERYANFYVDTAASICYLGRHPAQEVRAFFIRHQDRILFGTDLVLGSYVDADLGERPWEFKRSGYDYALLDRRYYETNDRQIRHPGYPVFGDWLVDGIGLPQNVLEKLCAGNARRLIPAIRV